MSIRAIITRGFGTAIGTIKDIVTRGFASGLAQDAVPIDFNALNATFEERNLVTFEERSLVTFVGRRGRY